MIMGINFVQKRRNFGFWDFFGNGGKKRKKKQEEEKQNISRLVFIVK